MIDIHIGMPRVGFRNLDFLEGNFQVCKPNSPLLVPRKFFREHIRSTVNASRKANSLTDVLAIRDSIQEWFSIEALCISQPALLGEPRQLLLSARARKKAAFRVHMLRAIFGDYPIRFHLMLTDQAEYLYRALSRDAEEIILRSEAFSWAALIDEIGLVDPSNSIIIWNCERGSDVMCQFLRDFINQPQSKADLLYKKSLGYRFPDSATIRQQFPERIKWRLDEYHNAFREDLAEIKRISGVTIVGDPQ